MITEPRLQVRTFGPVQATDAVDIDFVAASTIVHVDDSLFDSVSEYFDSDDESGSSFPWTEESSDEVLDYFVALDVAAAETSPRLEGAGDLPSARTGWRRRRVVGKRSVGELSRSGRCRRMGMERGRLGVDWVGKRELLTSPIGASIGEGVLRKLFEGEELRIMMFNYREMGIIPKVEPM
jgi:hypothetical protein